MPSKIAEPTSGAAPVIAFALPVVLFGGQVSRHTGPTNVTAKIPEGIHGSKAASSSWIRATMTSTHVIE
jgi:hypothetical protein